MSRPDARAFVAWLAGSLVVVFVLDHPAVDVLVTLAAAVVVASSPGPKPFRGFLALAVGFLVVRTILFGLSGHTGGTTLFVVPELHLPALLGGATLGGRVTAEVVLSSVSEGLRVVAVIAVFAAFLSATEVGDLLRLVPRFLFEAGLIVSIALVFAPQLARTARDIREGQTMRGARRKLGPALVPTFATALERSVALAESMDSRGYGRASGTVRQEGVWRAVAALALVATLALGSVWALGRSEIAGLAALAALAVGVWALWRLSRLVPRTRYRRTRFGPREAAVALVAGAAAAAALLVAGFGDTGSFDPYTALVPPAPHPAAALVALLLAAPALPAPKRRTG